MIRIFELNKYYNKGRKNQIHVINNTTLDLESIGLVALLGPSGCGKTTLLNAIGGLDKVNKGKIFIDNKKITGRCSRTVDKIRNMKIGYIFQDYKLLDNMTVYENVEIVLKMLGIKDKSEIKKRVDYILERVGMYRYRNRPCGMLSGGERQRVGIARAIVKNPDIILADEPTGNLDSKNTIEIMNIIKSISKDKLVILVTHEEDLAKFYATRIIELLDGEVVKDYKNDKQEELDYKIENKLYLKDFKNHYEENNKDINIDMYSDTKEKLNLVIVFKNGNIYIKNKGNDKIEVIDNNSNIELINDNYKKIDKSIFDAYSFDFDNIINKDLKLKYSSIFNIFSIIKYGFNKVFNYSLIKKLLLIGFFLSSIFTTYAISNTLGILDVKDREFVVTNKNYLMLESRKNTYEDYLKYKSIPGVEYVLPGSSRVSINIDFDTYYQTKSAVSLAGSLASTSMLSGSDIIYGKMPENNNELVIDSSLFLGSAITDNNYNKSILKQLGVLEVEDLLNKNVLVNTIPSYKIVGIVDKMSPSIYINNDELIKFLSYTCVSCYSADKLVYDYDDFSLKYKIKITEGKKPEKLYEVVVNENLKEIFKLNKKIDDAKINGNKLKVVGYYTSKNNINLYLSNTETYNAELITSSKNYVIYSKDKDKTYNSFKDINKYLKDVYNYDKEVYIENNIDSMRASLIVAGIMLVISLIEIILMVRSSFLSRIKEVGILRAIGVKKSDIYKMFSSESFAISTIASMPGVLFMSYCIYSIKELSYIESNYLINTSVILLCLIVIYLFNIFVGLIPVFATMRRSPARILSSHEVD